MLYLIMLWYNYAQLILQERRELTIDNYIVYWRYYFNFKSYFLNIIGYSNNLFIFFLKTVFLYALFKFIYDIFYVIFLFVFEIYVILLNFFFVLYLDISFIIFVIFFKPLKLKFLNRFFKFSQRIIFFVFDIMIGRKSLIAYKRKLDHTNVFAIYFDKQWDFIIKFFSFMVTVKIIVFHIIYYLLFFFSILVGLTRVGFYYCFSKCYYRLRSLFFKQANIFWYTFIFDFTHKLVMERFFKYDNLYLYHFKYYYWETKKLFNAVYSSQIEFIFSYYFEQLLIFKSWENTLWYIAVYFFIVEIIADIINFFLTWFFYFLFFLYEIYCLLKYFFMKFFRIKKNDI